jgi:hypothetical protein
VENGEVEGQIGGDKEVGTDRWLWHDSDHKPTVVGGDDVIHAGECWGCRNR